MKRILLLTLALIMVMSLLAACQNNKEEPSQTPAGDGSTQTNDEGAVNTETEFEENADNVINFDDLLAAAEDAQ